MNSVSALCDIIINLQEYNYSFWKSENHQRKLNKNIGNANTALPENTILLF